MEKKTNLITSLIECSEDEERINQITENVIGCSFAVANELGSGFLEKVYENALAYEIRKHGYRVVQQKTLRVYYDSVEVGTYSPDLFVEDEVVVELKTVNRLENIHRAQCLNYLNATNSRICLLINFGNPKVEVKRVVL